MPWTLMSFPSQTRFRAAAITVAILCLDSSARAALGGNGGTVEADRAWLAARMSSTAGSNYTAHLLTLPNGSRVREYARADGVVFAVTWRGRSRPDLQQLLGEHFQTFQHDNAPPGVRRSRRPLSVRRPDLVVSSGGHPGAFVGLALLPAMAPPGFSIADLAS